MQQLLLLLAQKTSYVIELIATDVFWTLVAVSAAVCLQDGYAGKTPIRTCSHQHWLSSISPAHWTVQAATNHVKLITSMFVSVQKIRHSQALSDIACLRVTIGF